MDVAVDESIIARANIPCVGLGYSGYWSSDSELQQFLANLPQRWTCYGSVYLRRAFSKFDSHGTPCA
jgi:hypothetical protein